MNDNFCVRIPAFRRGSVGDQAIVKQVEIYYDLYAPKFEQVFIEHSRVKDTLLYLCCDCIGYYDISVDGINNFIQRDKPVHLLNASWGEDVKSNNVSYIKSIQHYDNLFVYCRDKYSHELMLHDFDFVNDPILTSDIAHTCIADDNLSDTIMLRWIESCDDPIIGINIHRLFNEHNKDVERGIVQFIENHIDNYRFIFIPHDTRVLEAEYLNHICSQFPEDRCRVNFCMQAGQIQLLTKMLFMVITCRMHLSIFALSNNTPCIGISYNGCKTNGTYSHWNMDKYVLTPDNINMLSVLFEDIRDNYKHTVDKLSKLYYNIKQLAEIQLKI